MAFIDDEKNYLRLLNIVNSSIATIKFSQRFNHYFELYVRNSSLNSTSSFQIRKLLGSKANIIESKGFPNLIKRFHHLVVNFSFCNLTELPNFYVETITFDLRQNKLRNCSILFFTQILHLQYNEFESVNVFVDTRQSEARLQYLDLSYNKIGKIGRNDLAHLPNLLYLKLNKNFIAFIDEHAFSKMPKLLQLELSNNHLHSLNRNHFLRLSSLQFLDLQNNNLNVVEGLFDGLVSIQFLSVDYFTLCCAQPKVRGKVQCLAPINRVSSCENLIDTPFLGILIWYIALLAVLGNSLATFYRLYVLRRSPVSSFVIYSINLGVADFLMGVYVYIIAGANVTFTGRYGYADKWWRHSPLCTLAGVIATLSSEASALFVLLITIDRIYIIRFPFSNIKGKKLRPNLLSIFVWFTAILLASLPLFGTDYFDDYYSGSGICISLPLSVQRKTAWEYSMAVFVGANFLIFVAILVGQIVIFSDVVNAGKHLQINKSTEKRREIALAKTLIAVAVTDMFCWIPIGVIGLLTFLGVDVTSKVYAWVVVVVLPINSALNPLIYTFSAIIRLGRNKMRLKSEKCQNWKTQDEFTLEEKAEVNHGAEKDAEIFKES
ncbi:G-protein coupled receptor GRL101-like [Saccostrea echinata]|uniref:G-protein coupled receptor GRL101-like n=1 Tax=Saccostrea echinata TaxID=191078 RepID=UPI002A82EAFE|nr:G-protein coupled receptor GRL101-like [Saccostrea echinata]